MKVLVVDDTVAQRYVRSKTISSAGFQVIEAALGKVALERAAEADVLVLDVHLPDIDGMEVCRALRNSPATASLPIIHVSSIFVSDLDTGRGISAGADAYLIEPVPPDVLIRVIESTLEARRPAEESAVCAMSSYAESPSDLYSISYTSAAVRIPTDEDLSLLLEKARERNRREGVTGVLLYSEGTFHQYLEGPQSGVLAVYEAILRDPLHHHIFEMVREPIESREFEQWSMGFRGTQLVEGSLDGPALDLLLADDAARLSPGRLLLHAFWSKGLGARYQAALLNSRR